LGHLVGALDNWVKLQDEYECVYSIVDWHALMGEYEYSDAIRGNIIEMAIDWLSCGIDPEKSIVFVQSDVPQHLELFMALSCLTPLGWLERNPTYKEQLREITTRDLQTYAFLGYPVLQAADILLYKAAAVPIGEDQLPHVELTREIARRFNFMYEREVFPIPDALLTEVPVLPGIDGRKMSKSYGNAIFISEPEESVREKISRMLTDFHRVRRSDPGDPELSTVFAYHKLYSPAEEVREIAEGCRSARMGCVECKKRLTRNMLERLHPLREKRLELERNMGRVKEIIAAGTARARAEAAATISEVRAAVGLNGNSR